MVLLLRPETQASKLGFTGSARDSIAASKKPLLEAIDEAGGGLVPMTNEAPESIWRLALCEPLDA